MTLDDIKAQCDEEGECWIWRGAVSSTGYPIAKIAEKGQWPKNLPKWTEE